MSIKKLQNILEKIAEGPIGGIILGAFLFGALLIFIYSGTHDIPFIYKQF